MGQSIEAVSAQTLGELGMVVVGFVHLPLEGSMAVVPVGLATINSEAGSASQPRSGVFVDERGRYGILLDRRGDWQTALDGAVDELRRTVFSKNAN